MRTCIACNKPTLFSYNLRGMEASFCPEHLPKAKELMIRITVRI